MVGIETFRLAALLTLGLYFEWLGLTQPTATDVGQGRMHYLERSDHVRLQTCMVSLISKEPHILSRLDRKEDKLNLLLTDKPISPWSSCCLVRNNTTVLRHSSIMDQ